MTLLRSAGSALVFVGERRSQRARQLNASWTTGGLAASTLHAALRACGIEPSAVLFLNLFREGDGAMLVEGTPSCGCVRTVDVLIDEQAVTSGAAAQRAPWTYFVLGHGIVADPRGLRLRIAH